MSDMTRAVAWCGDALGFRTTISMPAGNHALHLFPDSTGPASCHVFAGGIEAILKE